MRHDQLFQYFQAANDLISSSTPLPEGFPPEKREEDYFALRFSYAELLHARLHHGISGSGMPANNDDRSYEIDTITADIEMKFYFLGFDAGYTTGAAHSEEFPGWLFQRVGWENHHRARCEASWRYGVRVGLAVQQEREAWNNTRETMFG